MRKSTVMQQDAADTNPFRKLAQQERERELLKIEKKRDHENGSPSPDIDHSTTSSIAANGDHAGSVGNSRPPIPVAPVLTGQNSARSIQQQSIPDHRQSSETGNRPPKDSTLIIDTTLPSGGSSVTQTGVVNGSPNEGSGDDYSNFVDSYADSNSDTDSDSSSNTESEVLRPIDPSSVTDLLSQTFSERNSPQNRVKQPSWSTSQTANITKLPKIETAVNHHPHVSITTPRRSESYSMGSQIPKISDLTNTPLSPAPLSSHIYPQSLNERSFISVDSPTLEDSSRLFNVEQSSNSTAPFPPLRPVPSANNPGKVRGRLSSLDPGSSSSIPSISYYGDYEGSSIPSRDDQLRPIALSSPNTLSSPNLPNRPTSPSLPPRPSPESPMQSTRPFDGNNRRFSGNDIVEPNLSESDLTPIVSTPVLSPKVEDIHNSQPHYTLAGNAAQVYAYQNHNTAEPASQRSHFIDHPELRSSLPVITVSTPETDAPQLPRKPLLPKRPPRSSSGSASAYELLENFGRRSSIATNSDRPQMGTTANLERPGDDLDMESLRNLGITEEMIRQQKEIEERIQRENVRERELRNQLIEQERVQNNQASTSLPSNNTGGQSMSNVSMTSELSTGHISNESHESEEVPDDVSQLEIPTSISRTTTASVENASEVQSAISSSPSSADLLVNEDLTEEEFISLLPPVPRYTQEAGETEISIPNGKAIDMMSINENHPQESPPEYTPVSDALKKIINRPQFSQTGGDNLSMRRRQQLEQQQQQPPQHHHHISQRGQHTSSSSRHRSGSGTSTSTRLSSRTTVEPRTTTRRLPPTRSMARYSS